ncbi:MAG TPA: hypothetical protein VF549_08225 [Solirubrobacteraceae bacterium]|jgi:hypothetical protein
MGLTANQRTARRQHRHAGDLLPVEALTRDGLLIRSDGAFVRYLEVAPTNPLVLDAHGCARMTRGFTELLTRVPPGLSVQCYAQATPVSLEDLIARSRTETDAATDQLLASPDGLTRAQGHALRRLAACTEDSLRVHAEDQAAVDVRYVLVVPWHPDVVAHGPRRLGGRRRKTDPLERPLAEHARFAREAQQHAERLRSALAGLDMKASLMSGPDVADLLWSRFSPAAAAARARRPSAQEPPVLASLDHDTDREKAGVAAARLRDAICRGELDLLDRHRLGVDGGLEHTVYVSRRPERTFYGWLLHAMQGGLPWTLSVHVHVRDRAEERDRHNRRARRLWGVNEGAADRRARPDRQQHDQQAELEELVDELSTGAETLCDVSIYQTLRAPGPGADGDALRDAVRAATRDLGGIVDAQVSVGEALQPDLWTSSLPLGLDAAWRTMPMITRNAADSVPFVSTSCGSPEGIPFAFANPGRTIERLHPFDRLHDNGTTLLFAKSGGGKTMTTISLAAAALPRGCQVNVIDRSAGHWSFLCTLIPGAAHMELGEDRGPTINAWDVDDVANVPRSKIAFLVRLHALLIGDHDAGEDAYGLGPLERNLLALAIRTTYARAATGEAPASESLLRQNLEDLASLEEGPETAAVYRNLAQRLGEFCGDGTYAYLFDRPTTVGAEDAPLVVFNTRAVPDDVAAPVIFAVLEFVSRRVERRYASHLRRRAEGRGAAGPLDGTSAVVVEEIWKLVGRRATGAWLVELAKRARHIGLWLIAITQQRSDLASREGRALLDNSTIQLFLRNGPDDVAHVAEALHLSVEEVSQITHLVTEKHSLAEAYLVNGERGRGGVTIRLGSHAYWLATSDPVVDVPWRELALEHAGYSDADGDVERSDAAFHALDLLADPDWQAEQSA